MNKISLPSHYNYIGVFLTLACNLKCEYCINHLSGPAKKTHLLNSEDWGKALNRLILNSDLPLSLQGGEPTVHPHFYQIIKAINPDHNIDLLTNIQFNPIEFFEKIPPSRLKRDSKYSSIRVSYHPSTMNWLSTLEKVQWMHHKGYSISLFGVLHPESAEEILRAQKEAHNLGLDFRTKEFLGVYNNQIFGTYKYPTACFSEKTSKCFCKTSELLISPNGSIYRCHHDLYNQKLPIGNLLDEGFNIEDIYRPCDVFGKCNPCDLKVKNNRFQEWGHTSVDIKF